MNRRQKIIVSITGIFIILLALVGLTYAYFLTKIKGNEETKSLSVTTADLKVEYQDGDAEFSTGSEDELIYPGFWAIKKFSVENLGTKDANYAVILDNVVNEFERTEDWQYELKYNGQTKTGTLKNSGTQILIESINIPVETKTDYEIKLIYNDLNEDQSVDMNKNLSLRVNITNEFEKMSGEELKATKDDDKVITLKKNTILTSSIFLDNSVKTIDLNNNILVLNPDNKDEFVYLDSQTTQEIKNGTIMRGVNLNNGSLVQAYGINSNLTLTDVVVDGNKVVATETSNSAGRLLEASGVLCNGCVSLLINNSEIINNYALGSGVGVKAISSEVAAKLTIKDSIIKNNKITTISGHSGSAMRASIETVDIVGTTIENNIADASSGTVDLSDSTYVTIDSNTIIRNNTATDASGIMLRNILQQATIAGTIEGNKSTAVDGNGGGIYTLLQAPNQDVIITETAKIINNEAAAGGGIYVNGPKEGLGPNGEIEHPGYVIMSGGIIEGNTAHGTPAPNTLKDGGGGGIYVARGYMEINDGIIRNNISTSNIGNAIVVSNAGVDIGGTLTVRGGTIIGSVAVPVGYGTLTLQNVTQNGDLIS